MAEHDNENVLRRSVVQLVAQNGPADRNENYKNKLEQVCLGGRPAVEDFHAKAKYQRANKSNCKLGHNYSNFDSNAFTLCIFAAWSL